MPKFGGPGRKKQCCKLRRCLNSTNFEAENISSKVLQHTLLYTQPVHTCIYSSMGTTDYPPLSLSLSLSLTHTHTHTHTITCTCTCTHTHTHTHTHTQTHTHTHTCTYMYMHTYTITCKCYIHTIRHCHRDNLKVTQVLWQHF